MSRDVALPLTTVLGDARSPLTPPTLRGHNLVRTLGIPRVTCYDGSAPAARRVPGARRAARRSAHSRGGRRL